MYSVTQFTNFSCHLTFQVIHKMQQSIENGHYPAYNMHIFDMPEEIFGIIFGFLTDAEVYFNVRGVCLQMKSYVENYTHIGKLHHKCLSQIIL